MSLRSIFSVFSRRRRNTKTPRTPLTPEFRSRVLMLCRDHFGSGQYRHGDAFSTITNYLPDLLTDVHRRMAYNLGRHHLSSRPFESPAQDLGDFVTACSDEHFLDFIEYIFQSDAYWRVSQTGDPLVHQMNELFQLDDLPYALTPFVRESRPGKTPFGGAPCTEIHLISAPQVILREDQVTYSEAVEPAIRLLSDAGFSTANQELIGALTEYRHGRHAEALTKCCSAFESTLKLVCQRRGWPSSPTDPAGALIKIVLAYSTLDTYFEPLFMTIATLRNRLSSAHGGGAQPRRVPPHRVRYAINATASAILLVVEECLQVD